MASPTPLRERHIVRRWPATDEVRTALAAPRDDLISEVPGEEEGTFVQADGPFDGYRRTVVDEGDQLLERTTYRLLLPWFGWLFALPVRWTIARRGRPPALPGDARGQKTPQSTPWWSPPDHLTQRQLTILGLLAASSMSSAFINTLFTQTVNFAADDFGVGDTGIGVAGSVVRAGIVIALPVAVLADRIGRRKVIVAMSFASPVVSAAGALAPSFPFLVATQAVGRPLGLALDFMVAVVAAEEMPRNSRAYAVSVLAMASGLGAGVAVLALPLADISDSGWRLVYVVALIWLVVAVDMYRRLPETQRFERPHVVATRLDRRRFGVLAAIALLTNLLIAPASFFQNDYLEDERGYSATIIAVFTLATATPAALGLIAGGRLADTGGRRRVVAAGLPAAAVLVTMSFSIGGPLMWLATVLAGIAGAVAYPALAVYRAELFPTGNRGRAAGLLTTSALVGGIGGLLIMGQLLDRGASHGAVIGGLALGQLAAVGVALRWLPETAHRELEDLNPEDLAQG